MLGLAVILFVIIVSQPSANYPRARFVFVLLRYVHGKKFEKRLFQGVILSFVLDHSLTATKSI